MSVAYIFQNNMIRLDWTGLFAKNDYAKAMMRVTGQ